MDLKMSAFQEFLKHAYFYLIPQKDNKLLLHFNQARIICNNNVSGLELNIVVSSNNPVLLLYPSEESKKPSVSAAVPL